jgi:magnesium chelatase subunit I
VQYYFRHSTDAEGSILRSYDDLVKHEGNALLFAAVEISIVSSLAGRPMHVHAEGVRGTGKTTIFRSAAGILPTIERIAKCEQNCRAWAPHCPTHSNTSVADLSGLASERIRMPFREISHSAKLGTVVGSIDLAQVMDRDKPQAALLLGTIPKSNRGILFVDEVNRLADTSPELTDVLLDVMGTRPGRVQVEEAGLPVVSMPVEISVWAASNPDEDPGPLEDVRRQLSDRFDLSVEMGRTSQASMIRRILEYDEFVDQGAQMRRRGDGFETGGAETLGSAASVFGPMASGSWPGRLTAAALLAPKVKFSDDLLELLASIYVDFDIESIRAMESARSAARCRAALAGRSCVSMEDVRVVLPLALRHRVDVATLANILRYVDALQEKTVHGHARSGAPSSYGGLARPGIEGPRTCEGTGTANSCDAQRLGHGEPLCQSLGCRKSAEPGSASEGSKGSEEPSGLECSGPGLRGVLHRLLERMRSEERLRKQATESGGSHRSGSGRAGCGSRCAAGEPSGGDDRGYAGGARSQAESGQVSEVCPPKAARPITDIGPKIVFVEDDLA